MAIPTAIIGAAAGLATGVMGLVGNQVSSSAQQKSLKAKAAYERKAAEATKQAANETALSKEYEYQAAISDKRREFGRFNASNRAMRGAAGVAEGGSNLLVEIENMTLQELEIQNMKVASDNQAKFTRYKGSVETAQHLNAAAEAEAGAANMKAQSGLQLASDIVGTIGKTISGAASGFSAGKGFSGLSGSGGGLLSSLTRKGKGVFS